MSSSEEIAGLDYEAVCEVGIVVTMRDLRRCKQTHPCSLFTLCISLCLLLAGCASSQTNDTPAGAQGHELRSQVKPIAGIALANLVPGSNPITFIEGEHEGRTITVTRERVANDACRESVPSIRSMTTKESSGELILLSEEDAGENVAITYDPPLVLLPREVRAGTRYENISTMTVHNLKTGSRRDTGQCQHTVELLGMQRIETPAGTFDAYLFKTTRKITLSLASVHVVIHTAHVPGQGIVMTRVLQETKPLGLFTITKRSEWRLAK